MIYCFNLYSLLIYLQKKESQKATLILRGKLTIAKQLTALAILHLIESLHYIFSILKNILFQTGGTPGGGKLPGKNEIYIRYNRDDKLINPFSLFYLSAKKKSHKKRL